MTRPGPTPLLAFLPAGTVVVRPSDGGETVALTAVGAGAGAPTGEEAPVTQASPDLPRDRAAPGVGAP